ncbi:5-(carboxyamino)imidazole ribonucleotide synthase [Schaalia suimastitidis]|uniref:5-(carboxyamino)imidazole ribonucleotide synthase n=1 Tax=Schaalia suimastitidis TaxID=121163 RepID=UPI0004133F74|nr:5-(carboxyamino)imidazole ribonucleotide synthase [Schaalia suimastitidis]
MEQTFANRPVVAVVGGGQLARMMQESAIALGIELRPLVEAANGSTGQVVVDAPVGSPQDATALGGLVDGANVLTFEHEHIPHNHLAELSGRLPVHPSGQALLYAQNKLEMRRRLAQIGAPCPRWAEVHTLDDIEAFADTVGWPIVLKMPTGGYDGHGVKIIDTAEQAAQWLDTTTPLLVEEKVPYISEAAALLARSPSGQVCSWPVVTTEQRNGVCAVVTAPAQDLPLDVAAQAQALGETIAQELGVTGVLAVELFVVRDGTTVKVMVNELAMRPHNSGHWTIDGAVTSQFEQHLRAVLDLPLGSTDLVRPGSYAVMVNLLGSTLPDPACALPRALAVDPAVRVHLYGKEVRPGRKLGHVTVVDADAERARAIAERAVECLAGATGHTEKDRS